MKQLLRKLIAGIDVAFLTDQERVYVANIPQEYLRIDGTLTRFNSKYIPGILKPRKDRSLFFLSLDDSQSIDIDASMLQDAQAHDIVLIQRIMGRSRHGQAKIVHILDKDITYSIGIVSQGILVELITKTPLPHDLGSGYFTQKPNGTLFLFDNKTRQLLKELGHIDDPLVDEAIALALYNRQEAFNSDVLDEVAQFGDSITNEEINNRVDLRHLDFVTIDPVTAKDFDDAIYFDQEKHTLYVAIADVSYYVKEESAIDSTAYTRGFSVYFPHKSIPMLPRELSENLCSLKPHVDRLSFVFEMPINQETLEVHDAKVYEAVIHSKRRFNYEEVDALLAKQQADNDVDTALLPMLNATKTLTDKLKTKRMHTGYEFRSHEIEITLDEHNAHIVATQKAQDTPSHGLVEDCMLLANIQASKCFDKGLYRVHDAPSLAKLDMLYHQLSLIGLPFKLSAQLKQTITSIQKAADEQDIRESIDTLLIQTQMQAHYASMNIGHFGLGFASYTHFTSPIRRYADLVVHRLIKAHNANDTTHVAKLLQPIDATAVDVSHKEREADDVAKNFTSRKYARFAHAHLDTTISAQVIAIDEAPKAISCAPIVGMPIALDSLPMSVKLFDTIDVKLNFADYTTNQIRGSYIDASG